MLIEDLKDKKLLILGFAREGIDNFLFLRKNFPNKIIGVGDKKNLKELTKKAQEIIRKDKRIKTHLGKNYLRFIKNYDVIIKSPGIPFKSIAPFLSKNQIITSQTEIFLENCKGTVIGITGTKGKSTTSSLTYHILSQNIKKEVNLIGNIGKPALSFLEKETKNKIFVYEMSSHQLCHLRISPQIAVFLNIYPEHLDYYKNFKEYIRAKANITLWQRKNDFLIFNPENKIIREIAKKSRAKRIEVKPGKYKNIIKKLELKNIPEINIAAAIEIARLFKIPIKSIKKSLQTFKTLPHRLEFVGEFKKIKFYNDSLSTIPQATIFALNNLGNNVETLILGGKDRGVDFEELVREILKRKVKNIILFPDSGIRILEELLRETKKRKNKLPFIFFTDNMREAVKISYLKTNPGKICLLSPASPSFSCFKDYKERGNLFKKYIKNEAKKSR